MNDEPRDPPESGDEEPAPAGDEPTPAAEDPTPGGDEPKPATWAGRQRAEADRPEEPDEPEEPGADEPDAEEPEPADESQPDARTPQETMEADTIRLSDREAAEEAAHAGLRARTEESTTARGVTTGSHHVTGPPPVAHSAPLAAAGDGAGEPPKRTVWWRFFAGSLVVVTSVAAATAVAFLLYLTDVGADLRDPGFGDPLGDELSEIDGDEPQTVLILGSDKRTTAPGDPGRSDTTMLLRVDPEKQYLALLSLPRDLRVEIPGYGTDKLNAAYSYGEQFDAKDGGGPKLTLKTVKELLGIEINHIVNIDFEGFYDAVNAIGCVYIDVDRHYYNPPETGYDDIDIQAGYTKLCGYRALDYVRYRHGDSDIVRGTRQQDFLREARQQIPPRDLLPPPFGSAELIDIFTEHTSSDIDNAPTIVEMLKSFVDVRNSPVRQVDLESAFETIDGVAYVTASQEQVDTAVKQFLGEDLEAAPTEPAPAPQPDPDGGGGGGKKGGDKPPSEPAEPAMIDASSAAVQYAQNFAGYLKSKKAEMAVFYPTQIVSKPSTAITDESRAYPLASPDDRDIYRGYKFVISYQDPEIGTGYYGLTGVNWTDPPILNNPSETREIDGREYLLFYDRDRLRLVGWKTAKGSYWVINTLTKALSEQEMLAVATSARELDD